MNLSEGPTLSMDQDGDAAGGLSQFKAVTESGLSQVSGQRLGWD